MKYFFALAAIALLFVGIGCSGAPTVLSQHWNELKPGLHVAVPLVGAGLTWTHMLLKVEGE